MTNLEYWEIRSRERQKKHEADAQDVLKRMNATYKEARNNIESDLFSIFGRFMSDNGLSVADAQELLSGQEFKRWRKSLAEYMKDIEAVGVDSLEGRALWLEVEVLSARSRISRLDALHALIGANMAQVAALQEKAVAEHLETLYYDDFVEGGYEFYRMGLETAVDAAESGALALSNAFVHEVITEPWSGAMFSSRIWKNEWNMAQRVSEMVGRSLIAGHSTKRIARDIEEALGVDRRNAERLILTESAHVKTEADLQLFYRLDIKQVEFNVTLDSRTCTTECAHHDGEIIAIKDLKDGVNKPPLHPRCRCVLLPYNEALASVKKHEKRIARNAGGENIRVDGDMTYKEWRKMVFGVEEHNNDKGEQSDESSTQRVFVNLGVEELKKRKGKITKEERRIIYGTDYLTGYIKSGNSFRINKALRNNEELEEDLKTIATTLQRVIDKNTMDCDIMVYRYIDEIALENMTGIKIPKATARKSKEEFFEELEEAVKMLEKNTTYVEKGFMSTSGIATQNVFTTRNVLLRIGVPSGSHCYVTTNNLESEIILGQGTRLVIKEMNVENSGNGVCKIVVDCEVKKA